MTTETISPEARLRRAGIELPALPPSPIGAFANARRSGGLIFVSGQGPIRGDGSPLRGKVGRDVTADEARQHAELVARNILAVLRTVDGGLDAVSGVVKLVGLVNATPDFDRHSYVIDGASDLFAEVFGPGGVHARTSFGVSSLPNGITVEIEAIVETAD